MTTSLDLGCGNIPRNPYGADTLFGVDVIETENENIKVADLVLEPIPFADCSFDFITGYDFIEHIPRIVYVNGKRRQPFIELMNEVYRCLRFGGVARFHTPAYPHSQVFQDPQHVNFISVDTVYYFCVPSEESSSSYLHITRSYGFYGQFKLKSQKWCEIYPYHLIWELEKI